MAISNTFIISAQSQCHTPKNCESSTQCSLDTFYGMYGISRTLMPAHARSMASTGYQPSQPSGDVFGSDPIHWLRRNRVSRHKQVSTAVTAYRPVYRPLEADTINDNESKRFAEVNLADTLNYRTLKPIKGGLFCETLFGPIKDWECQCGRLKFTRAPKTELWCPSCVVQITRSVIRRVRMAYINLAAPVMHIWYKKQSNNPLVQVLSLNAKDITSVLDAKSLCIASPEWVTCCTPSMSIFDFHIWQNEVYPFIKGEKGSFDVDVPWNTFYSLPENLNASASGREWEREWVAHAFSYFKDTSTFAFSQLFTRLSYKEGLLYIQYKLSLLHSLGYSHRSLLHKQMFSYLCNYHSNREASSARKAMHTPLQILQKKKHLLHSYTLFKRTLDKSHALNSLFLKYIPVLPPDLRPIIQVESGKFATSDVNDLYRFVIFRNNRLKRFLQQNVPEAIFYQELRLVQHSVDALFDNGKLKQPISRSSMYEDFEPLKSLSDRLVGKRGRFRLNLLGKRVDYSGRSVIVVGPKLRLFQCGLPIKMAFELFFPFLIQYVLKKALAKTTKSAKVFLREHPKVVRSALGEIVHSHPVILNRAPTLHRMGVQSFFPVLVEGKAIQLHPLMCPSFNADFDGDQMAVHIPLRLQSHIECRFLMLSAHNWLSPANGESIINLSQDMVLGFYYLTFASAYNEVYHHSKETKAIVNKGCKLHDMFWINFNEYAPASDSYMITQSTLNESITTCVVSRTGWLYKMYATRVKLEDSFAKYRLLYVLTSVGRMIFNNYLFWRI
jgi:DNA-directed RNA polymerase subunit beta'